VTEQNIKQVLDTYVRKTNMTANRLLTLDEFCAHTLIVVKNPKITPHYVTNTKSAPQLNVHTAVKLGNSSVPCLT